VTTEEIIAAAREIIGSPPAQWRTASYLHTLGAQTVEVMRVAAHEDIDDVETLAAKVAALRIACDDTLTHLVNVMDGFEDHLGPDEGDETAGPR
jgi:hypothetical protein